MGGDDDGDNCGAGVCVGAQDRLYVIMCAINHQKTFPTVRIFHIAIITLNIMLT